MYIVQAQCITLAYSYKTNKKINLSVEIKISNAIYPQAGVYQCADEYVWYVFTAASRGKH